MKKSGVLEAPPMLVQPRLPYFAFPNLHKAITTLVSPETDAQLCMGLSMKQI